MKRVSVRLLLCSMAAVVVCSALLRARQDAPRSDTQKLVLENAFVRVFEIRMPPGTFEPRHSHGRGLTIALSDYENETRTDSNGAFNRGRSKLGDVRWAEPVTHEARNVGTTEQRVIRIELK